MTVGCCKKIYTDFQAENSRHFQGQWVQALPGVISAAILGIL